MSEPSRIEALEQEVARLRSQRNNQEDRAIRAEARPGEFFTARESRVPGYWSVYSNAHERIVARCSNEPDVNNIVTALNNQREFIVGRDGIVEIVRLLGVEKMRADAAEKELADAKAEHAQELADLAVEVEAAKQRAL